jgi:hypothetical protein
MTVRGSTWSTAQVLESSTLAQHTANIPAVAQSSGSTKDSTVCPQMKLVTNPAKGATGANMSRMLDRADIMAKMTNGRKHVTQEVLSVTVLLPEDNLLQPPQIAFWKTWVKQLSRPHNTQSQ